MEVVPTGPLKAILRKLKEREREGERREGRKKEKERKRDFPGGPMVETLCFPCGGHGFDPWSGN